MPELSVAQPMTDLTSTVAIRERNRVAQARESAIQNVVERLDVYGHLAEACAIHPKVTRQYAEQIVAAVLAIAHPREERL